MDYTETINNLLANQKIFGDLAKALGDAADILNSNVTPQLKELESITQVLNQVRTENDELKTKNEDLQQRLETAQNTDSTLKPLETPTEIINS